MTRLQQIVFLLVRYCGNPAKRESINIGVIALTPETDQSGSFADLRFTQNWRRLQCFDPLAEIEELHAIEREIRQDLLDPQRRAELLKRAGDAYSDTIRFDLLQGCLTESPAKELEQLRSLYLETFAATEKREVSGRQRILNTMKDELQRSGVLPMML